MTDKNQQEPKISGINKVLRMYSNVVANGILSIIVGLILYVLLINYLHLNFILVFGIVLMINFLIAPLVSKVTIGEKLLIKYLDWCERLANGNRKKN